VDVPPVLAAVRDSRFVPLAGHGRREDPLAVRGRVLPLHGMGVHGLVRISFPACFATAAIVHWDCWD
jgi:hypothetical protein